MKIEKLTENKIRIILKSADLKVEHIDVKAIMTKNTENQDFFFDLLEMAKAEVGFDAEGCKVLIEAFSPSDENVVFTITKYPSIEKKKSTQKLKIKKKVKKLQEQIKLGKITTQEAHKYLTGHMGYIKIANVKNLTDKLFYKE